MDVVMAKQSDVTPITFEAFDPLTDIFRSIGIRIFGRINDPLTGEFLRESKASEDLEPEYIAVSPDGKKAFATMQENNAIAVIDLETNTLIDLAPLGFKDHSIEGNGLDASDKDGGINIQTWPVMGMYMPDAIASFESLGKTFVVSANEGDSRDYDGFSEEVRVEDLVLDQEAYPEAEMLQALENLGRINNHVHRAWFCELPPGRGYWPSPKMGQGFLRCPQFVNSQLPKRNSSCFRSASS